MSEKLDQDDLEKTEVKQEEEKEEFVPKKQFDDVLTETKKRKQEIRDLKAKLIEAESKTQSPDDKTKDHYEQIITQKDREIQVMKHQRKVEKLVEGMLPINLRVADLAYQDGAEAGVLEDKDDLSDFLKEWKAQNPTLFKQENKNTVTKPVTKTEIQTPSEKAEDLTIRKTFGETPAQRRVKELARSVSG
jgi:hypothetical protein